MTRAVPADCVDTASHYLVVGHRIWISGGDHLLR